MYFKIPKNVFQLYFFLECKTKGYVLFSMLCVALGSFLLPNHSVTVAAKKGGSQRSKGVQNKVKRIPYEHLTLQQDKLFRETTCVWGIEHMYSYCTHISKVMKVQFLN